MDRREHLAKYYLNKAVTQKMTGQTPVYHMHLLLLCADQLGQCPKCGSEAWVNIDCDLCMLVVRVQAIFEDGTDPITQLLDLAVGLRSFKVVPKEQS